MYERPVLQLNFFVTFSILDMFAVIVTKHTVTSPPGVLP